MTDWPDWPCSLLNRLLKCHSACLHCRVSSHLLLLTQQSCTGSRGHPLPTQAHPRNTHYDTCIVLEAGHEISRAQTSLNASKAAALVGSAEPCSPLQCGV